MAMYGGRTELHPHQVLFIFSH